MKAARISAFTLIELLVVIVIIGILTAIMAPDYLRFKQKIDLKDSTSLLQTGFQEAYSLARSRSLHYEVVGTRGAVADGVGFFQIKECTDFTSNDDGDGLYNCSSGSTIVPSASGTLNRKLEGHTVLTSDTFTVRFLAPHGDMQIITPSSDPLMITLDNDGLTTNLYAHPQSGLVTTDTP